MYVLYRAWKADGSLLYVGSTKSFGDRMKAQMGAAWWWLVDYVSTEDIGEDEKTARAIEKATIQAEHPRWNIVWRSPKHPDGPASTSDDIYAYHPEDFKKAPEGWGGVVSEHLPPGEKVYHLNRMGQPIPADIAEAAAAEDAYYAAEWQKYDRGEPSVYDDMFDKSTRRRRRQDA
jgi:hypothetical protein